MKISLWNRGTKGGRTLHKIGTAVTKKDHNEKTTGEAIYIADLTFPDMLHANVLRSQYAHADILEIQCPKLDEGYEIITGKDAGGVNGLKIIQCDQPLFAEKSTNYIGEAILMVVGPDEKKVQKITDDIKVTYAEKTPLLELEHAKESFCEYFHEKGSADIEFDKAHQIFEEVFHTGYQEQAYLEMQGAIGCFEDGKVTVYGSLQCPYYVKTAVEVATGLPPEKVQIIQTTIGGAFGGKEDYPSMICCMVAIAAMKVKKPVRLILNRREDMAVTPKRHPGMIKYRTAVDRKGNILAVDVDIRFNAGAYDGLSSVVMQRAVIAAAGVYKVPALRVRGHVLKTNTVPNGAFRGFGAPQLFFGMEMNMLHIAKKLGVDPIDYKSRYWVHTGDPTSTNGCFVHEVKLDEMVDRITSMSDFHTKYRLYENQTGRFRRGIGLSLFLHGCGYTGSGERDFVKAVVRLAKHEDDRVEILAANTDMGQGIKTTFSKIVANVLQIPLEDVFYNNPDTDRVPNSGPTVASRTLMIVGKLLERAASRLKGQWKKGEELIVEEHYVHPDLIPWDLDTFTGDAYPAYSWGVNVVEVEADTLLFTTEIKGIWGIFDIGTVIDESIVRGQAEGGMLQGLGYASMERMETGESGRILQTSLTDYIIPTAKDTVAFEIEFIDNPYENGPFGAKGVGELTILGTAPAYTASIEQAFSRAISHIPVKNEMLMDGLL
jgi:CO/xanthine dehydrogenase Mo-binding subunit